MTKVLLSILFIAGCTGKPKVVGKTLIDSSPGIKIEVQLLTEDGKPIDSNTVIPPSPGIRNVFLFDGHSWTKCEYGSWAMEDSSKYLVYIFEFIYKGIKGRESYIVDRVGLSREKTYNLQRYIWDDKMFNCGCTYNEGTDDALDGFCVDMDNAGTLHGGNLRTLKDRIASYLTPKSNL
jgi:hypothetical protein